MKSKIKLLTAGLLLISSSAFAHDVQTVELKNVISAVTMNLDIMTESSIERAMLIQEKDGDVSLVILDMNEKDELEVTAKIKQVAYSAENSLEAPSLQIDDINSPGKLFLNSSQYGIGRNPWEQKVTIVSRDGELVVAGLDYSSYDRLSEDPDASATKCSVNLLTGKRVLNGKVSKVAVDTNKLKDVNISELSYKLCN